MINFLTIGIFLINKGDLNTKYQQIFYVHSSQSNVLFTKKLYGFYKRSRFFLLAAFCLFLISGCGGNSGGTTATGVGAATAAGQTTTPAGEQPAGGFTGNPTNTVSTADQATFSSLFAATVAHPRCVNCHAFDEGGQTRARHRRRSRNCSNCHNQDDFRESPASMTFTNRSASQICNTTVNRRGSTDAMATLLRTSPHVAWSISDGSITSTGETLRLAPPGNQAAWLALIDRWVAVGSSCQ